MTYLPCLRRAGFSLSLVLVAGLAACGGGEADGGSPTMAHESALAVAATKAAVTTKSTTTGSIVVRAKGVAAANVWPKMTVRVNGDIVGSVDVQSDSYADYSFNADVPSSASIDIVYTNDQMVNGVDRNLFIESMTINGTQMAPDQAGVTYDRGSGTAAFDGIDMIAARSDMRWNGALRFKGPTVAVATAVVNSSTQDAARLADQASFGPTESLITTIKTKGAAGWIAEQMKLTNSRYTLGNGDAIHKNVSGTWFCYQPAYQGTNCWRDWYSAVPLSWDFYRNAMQQPDQLRQRVAFALQQLVVISGVEVEGTYGLRNYQNMLLNNAFGNYRQLLKNVALSPVMGDYLSNVNNDKAAPNENFGRELLQLFSIGTCELNGDGSLKGGDCIETYDNDIVRNYAYALTGWTYPVGGSTGWGCWPAGTNCLYYGGDMVPTEKLHDTNERKLLSGVTVPAGSTAPDALERVLDSVMSHPNIGPFIGRQLIQQLVSSNPSPAYVKRVADAFTTGRYVSGSTSFGAGQRGDLAATVAAVLLDAEARTATPARSAGKVREPILMFTGVLRALNGKTDGSGLAWWGETLLRQPVFRSPTVFNFYPPNYPVPGSAGLVSGAFSLHNVNAALERLNYLTFLLYGGGATANSTVPGAVGTQVNLAAFDVDADDPAKLVDRFSVIATGAPLAEPTRSEVVAAVASYSLNNSSVWRAERVKQAALLVFATPDYQVQQ